MQLDADEKLTTDNNVSCSSSKVSFSGRRFITGPSPDSYIEVRSEPRVQIAPVGAYPFNFCDPAFKPHWSPAKLTGSIKFSTADPAAMIADPTLNASMAAILEKIAGFPSRFMQFQFTAGDGAQQPRPDANAVSLAERAATEAVLVFQLNVPEGLDPSRVVEDFNELSTEQVMSIAGKVISEAGATLPAIGNVTLTQPTTSHRPYGGFCMLGYTLFDGVLKDNFGACENTSWNGVGKKPSCVLLLDEAQALCESSSFCAGITHTGNDVWIARHPPMSAGVGGLPLVANAQWKSCLKPEAAAIVLADISQLCASFNQSACASGELVAHADLKIGNTSEACCSNCGVPADAGDTPVEIITSSKAPEAPQLSAF